MSDYSGSRFESAKRGAGTFLSNAIKAIVILGSMLAVMWVLEGVDYVMGGALDSYGIAGWDADGLVGIFFAPFLHGGFGHLMANSLPLLVLGFLAAVRDIRRFLWATLVIVVIGGFGTWVSSPGVITIGASGLVFGYFGFVLARGLFDRRLVDILIGIGVGVAYYSILWGLLPNQQGISWQGHLFGLVGGVVAAGVLPRRRTLPARF
ncbi:MULTISPECIES: rhomboid family intramembrane serine protease [unclassified Nonomuraea]|uniref:rhomboid family intramembrane serine protease n=1 Tax=unclassified Nonomuraea TaxID=2593643 RepID=UPI0033FCCD4B